MIRDRDVFVPALPRRLRHLFQRSPARRVSVVCMCRSPRMCPDFHQLGSRSSRRQLDLAQILAQFRRNPRAAPAPRKRPLPFPPRPLTSSAPRNSPYSLSFNPIFTARVRMATLWSLLPVKYCSAAPKALPAAARARPPASPRVPPSRSPCSRRAPALPPPWDASRTAPAPLPPAGPVTSRSRSPIVSRPRRKLPAGVICSIPGVVFQIRSQFAPPSPPRSSADSAPSAAGIARSTAVPSLPASRPCAAARAASARCTAAPVRRSCPPGSARTAARYSSAPSPWIFRNSSAPGGNFCSSRSRRSHDRRATISSSTERQSLADARNVRDLPLRIFDDLLDPLRMTLHRRRPVAIAADAERILPRDLHQIGGLP